MFNQGIFNLFKVIFVFLMVHFQINAAVVGAYYENYAQHRPGVGHREPFSMAMIDTQLLTDLYYAFAALGYVNRSVDPANPRLTGDFTIQPTEGNDQSVLYPQVLKLKQESAKGLNLFLSVGGWNFNDPNDPEGVGRNTYRLFSQMVSTKENRKQFIESAVEYLHRFGFDGLDIDWEYPGDLTRGGAVEDFANFVTFLKECKEAFGPAKLYLSYSAPAYVPAGLPKEYREDPSKYFKWLAKCSEYLDRINVMAYNYHGPFDIPKITGANSPLNRDTDPKSPLFIAKTLDNYLNHGVPAEKMVLGLPAYGNSYAGVAGLSLEDSGPGKFFVAAGEPGPATKLAGLLAYYEIADKLADRQLLFGVDMITSTVYGFQIASQSWVSFDVPETSKLKAQLALSRGLNGAVLWAIDLDEYQWAPRFPNLKSISDVFSR